MDNITDITPARRGLHRSAGFLTGIAATLVAGIVFAATTAGAAGEADESTFVPITPCRLFDTRPAPENIGPRNTPLGANDTHVQQVTGTNGECTIPAGATGIALNATSLSPNAESFLTFWPSDAQRPLASMMNLRPGQPATPNKVDVRLSADGRLSIYNYQGSVNLLADVVGYYTRVPDAVQVVQVGDGTNSLFATGIDTAPTSIVSVTMTAPANGTVIADYAAVVDQTDAGQWVRCQVNTSPSLGSTAFQQFESPGANGSTATLSGPRLIDVTAGESVTIHLVCASSDASASVRNGLVTATFTSTIG